MQWQKRRLQSVKRCYLCRLAPQCTHDPLYIVPKAVAEHSWAGLDSRGVFLVQVPGKFLHSTNFLRLAFRKSVIQSH
jgi:hypothetical protein